MATASASHTERQLLPPDGTKASCPWGGATHVCAFIPTCKGGFANQGSSGGLRCSVHHALCVQAYGTGSTYVSVQTWGGGHTRAQACAYLCAALQEAPASASGPT